MKLLNKFTLIELLLVIAIISILASMLLPTLKKVNERTKNAVCQNNLKQMALGASSYAGDFDAFLPAFDDNSYLSSSYLSISHTSHYYRNAQIHLKIRKTGNDPVITGFGNAYSGGYMGTGGGIFYCPFDKVINVNHVTYLTGPSYTNYDFNNAMATDRWVESSYYYRCHYDQTNPCSTDAPNPIRLSGKHASGKTAFLTDTYFIDDIMKRHQTGTNSAYLDGHMEWYNEKGALTAAVSSLNYARDAWPILDQQ